MMPATHETLFVLPVIASFVSLAMGVLYVGGYALIVDYRNSVARNALLLGVAWCGASFAGLALHLGWDGHGWIGTGALTLGALVLADRCRLIFKLHRAGEKPPQFPEV